MTTRRSTLYVFEYTCHVDSRCFDNYICIGSRFQHEFYTYLSRDTYRAGAHAVDDEHESSTLHRQQTTLRRHKTNNDPNQLFK